MTETWYTIVNPHAGSGKTISEWTKAERMLAELGIPYAYAMTRGAKDAIALTESASRSGYRRFLCVGGDGTIHEVLNGIMSYVDATEGASVSEFTIAAVPIGSGNDWIRTAGVPNDTLQAVRLLLSGHVSRQDVVKVEHIDEAELAAGITPTEARTTDECRYMVNIAGAGLDANVCRMVNRLKTDGVVGKNLYLSILIKSLFFCRRYPIELWADGKKIYSKKFLALGFGIGKYCGGGMSECPLSLPDDGLLDCTVIPNWPIVRLLPVLPRLFNGKLLDVKALPRVKAKTITVVPTPPSGHPSGVPYICPEGLECDGEDVMTLPCRLTTLPEMINVVTGPSALHQGR